MSIKIKGSLCGKLNLYCFCVFGFVIYTIKALNILQSDEQFAK